MISKKNIACSTNAFLMRTLEESLLKIHELGVLAVEILCDYPHLYPPEINLTELLKIEKLLLKKKLHISTLNANTASGRLKNFKRLSVDGGPSLISNSFDERKKRIDYTKNVIKIAKDLGARNISISSGYIKNSSNKNKLLKYFTDSLKKITDFAEKFNVEISVEPEPGHLINNISVLKSVLKKIDSNLLGINFDVGHSYLANENPSTTIKSVHKKIFNVHIEDIKNKNHVHLPLGDGNIDFVEIFKTFNKIGYSRFITLELYSCYKAPEKAIKKSLKLIDELILNLKPLPKK